MKGTNDISVHEINEEAIKICIELSDRGYPSVAVGLIGQMIQVSAGVITNTNFSDFLLKKQVNNVVKKEVK